MNCISKLGYALELLDDRLCAAVMSIPEVELRDIFEIRLRRRRLLTVTTGKAEYFVSPSGRLSRDPLGAVTVTDTDIEFTFLAAVKHSIQAFEREISQGYVTAKGGCRVGFCGKAVCTPSGIASVKDISSVNIRIAREVRGCAEDLYKQAFSGGPVSLLIAGPPASGKTTLLRDLCRLLSEHYTVTLIDERNELAAVSGGIAYNDVGARTDIYTSYPKLDAVISSVRAMAPQFIVCDEIGDMSDLPAFDYALDCGARLIATCHAGSLEALYRRKLIAELVLRGAFDKAVLLGGDAEIIDLGGFENEACSKHYADSSRDALGHGYVPRPAAPDFSARADRLDAGVYP